MHRSILSKPLLEKCGNDFPIVHYVDDTLLVMEAFPKHLIALKALLNTFADSTGLRVNYQKSNIYPINVDEDRMKALANTF
jgi:hypothetical protein